MANSRSTKIILDGLCDSLKPDAIEPLKIGSNVIEVPISEISNFPNHPFKVVNNEAMAELIQSIKDNGLIIPAIIRKNDNGGYELVSGHRRKMACELAGLDTMPVIVRELDKAAATITMVDSNMQRESILPSEKAFAYKMKLEAMKHQGIRIDTTSSQLGMKLQGKQSLDTLGENVGESRNQIHRYIRLTELMPQLLEMVDNKQIAFGPAVEISYLTEKEQADLLYIIEREDATPTLSQSQRIKSLSQEGRLDSDKIFTIMTEEKPNQKEQIKIKKNTLEKFFPKSYSAQQIESEIMKIIEAWYKRKEQNKDAR